MKNVNIKNLFYDLQEQMKATLNTFTYVNHPGTKGDATELNWIEWMRNYLPNRYQIDKAFIIDHKGNMSDQIDVVIYDRQYSPLVFNQNKAIYIPAESVYAVFEVKQVLHKEHLDYAAEKGESVRKLERTSVQIPHAGGTYKEKKHLNIISGILTSKCDWVEGIKSDAFTKNFLSFNSDKRIDIGCCLNAGGFARENDSFCTSNSNEALIFFYIKLFTLLRNLATVPAIDMIKYGEALDSIK